MNPDELRLDGREPGAGISDDDLLSFETKVARWRSEWPSLVVDPWPVGPIGA